MKMCVNGDVTKAGECMHSLTNTALETPHEVQWSNCQIYSERSAELLTKAVVEYCGHFCSNLYMTNKNDA